MLIFDAKLLISPKLTNFFAQKITENSKIQHIRDTDTQLCPFSVACLCGRGLVFVGSNRPAGGRAHKPMTRPARRSKDPSPVRGGREGRRPEGRRRSKRGGGTGDGRSPPPRSRRVGLALCGWLCAAGSVGLCAAGSVRLALWGSVYVHK